MYFCALRRAQKTASEGGRRKNAKREFNSSIFPLSHGNIKNIAVPAGRTNRAWNDGRDTGGFANLPETNSNLSKRRAQENATALQCVLQCLQHGQRTVLT
jgi:hypothetical protein